jgi:hypothetical protein
MFIAWMKAIQAGLKNLINISLILDSDNPKFIMKFSVYKTV